MSNLSKQTPSEMERHTRYVALMARNYPPALMRAGYVVARDLLKHKFKPSAIFKASEPAPPTKGGKNAHYSAHLVFETVFEDRQRMEDCFKELGEEGGFDPSELAVVWADDVVPRVAYDANCECMAADHYAAGTNFKGDAKEFKQYKMALKFFTRPASGKDNATTVLHAHMPGGRYDGTSCFNIIKELLNRYYGEEPNRNVFKGYEIISMTDEAAKNFDNIGSILMYVLLLPWTMFLAQSCIQWAAASHEAGFPQMKENPRDIFFMNMSEENSKKLAATLKKRENPISPTAALIYAYTEAYRKELEEYPYCVAIQASLQTRAFAPMIKERNLIGDWLIAPLHYVRKSHKEYLIFAVRHFCSFFGINLPQINYYTIEDAQAAYKKLIADLNETKNSVVWAFYARVLGTMKGGAAQFEKHKDYPDDNRLMDSLFFNNYGRRTFHSKSNCRSFNWSGPGKLNVNCVLVNNRICAVIASQQLGKESLIRIRDQAHRTLINLANGVDDKNVTTKELGRHMKTTSSVPDLVGISELLQSYDDNVTKNSATISSCNGVQLAKQVKKILGPNRDGSPNSTITNITPAKSPESVMALQDLFVNQRVGTSY